MSNKMYITTVEKTHEQYHRSPIIIHNGWQWYFAEFYNMKQLKEFLDFAELEIKLEKEEKHFCDECGTIRTYSVNRELDDNNGYFWKLSDVPSEAKKIKGLSNGSIVDCYLYNDGKTLHVYRPNSNAKEIYKPLTLKDHINYRKEHGLF